MLKKLIIEQFVIIEKLALELKPALTILTGETGAGKSILLDAMGLVLGDPSSPESIRQGHDSARIEAFFSIPAAHPVWTFLVERKLARVGDTELHIHRTLRQSGADDILVNDQPLELDALKEIGLFLVEIHGQFANQSLLAPENQRHLLDLSGNFPPEIFKNVAGALANVHRYTRELEEENVFLARHKREMPKIEEVVGRFTKLGMREGFIADLESEYARLRTAKETSDAFQSILAQLISSNGIVMALSSINQILARQKNLDEEKVAPLTKMLSDSLVNARNAVAEIRRVGPEYEIDTGPLHRYKDMLAELASLAKEAKIPYENLPAYWAEMSGKLDRLRNGTAKLAELTDKLQESKRDYRHHAHILSEKRVIAGEEMAKAITAEFPPLKLPKAEFRVTVKEEPTMEWSDKGIDVVTFMARMNPGMPFSPIADTASGGELARMILGLKVVLQRVQTIPTLVFDEVDTGIGGAAAAAVGERLAQLAENTQVLVITHSPQVASRGNQHLHVSKKTDGVTTTSVVNQLTHDERVDEISRMLAGDQLTAESHAAARRLMEEAGTAAAARHGA